MVNLINTIIIAIVLLNSANFTAGEEIEEQKEDEETPIGPIVVPYWVPAVGITCGILLVIVVVSIGGYFLWKNHQDR